MSGLRKDVLEEIQARKMRPILKDGVFLLHDEILNEETSPGGIITLRQGEEKNEHRRATVVSVGRDVRGVAPNDRVLVGKYYGKAIPHDDDQACKLILVSEDQIDALITEDE